MALVGAAAFVAPGSAWATTGHSFVGQFGGYGTGDGQFAEFLGTSPAGPAGVGVLASTSEVFTVDQAQTSGGAAPRVQRFSADGVFLSAFPTDATPVGGLGSLAVDPAGAVYVSTSTHDVALPAVVVKYSASGAFVYELDASGSGTTLNNPFLGPAPLAVDPVDGTVYAVATHEDGRQVIDRFDGSTGAFIDFIDGSGSVEGGFACTPSSLAVDGSQGVYVLDPCKNRVDRFSAAGVVEASLDLQLPSAETLSAVAVDPVSGEVYVSHTGPVGMQITHFSAGGVGVEYTFDASMVGGVRAMAVGSAGTVYTSDLTRPFVQRFARFDGPTVVTGGTSSVEARSVVLEGTINPEGVDSSYYFEYGTDLTYGKRSPAVGGTDVGDGGVAVSAAAPVEGLEPNKTYFYRLVGSNSSGSIAGAAGSFTTLSVPPDVGGTGFASSVTPRSARLHGTVNPNNNPFAGHYVEFGTTTAYGRTADALNQDGSTLSSGGRDVPVTASVSGLEPGTTYHFRVVAGVSFSPPFPDPQFGADQTFVTAPAAGGGATDVTTKRATLTGTINPHGEETTYYFNYGQTASYGASTPEVGAGSGDGDQVVTDSIAGLKPDTTYHVQVVAKSGDVTRFGGDGLFKTALAPKATAISPTGISTDSATLAGDVETHGQAGSYRFDVSSLDSDYSLSTAPKPVSGHASAEHVTAPISGLPAGERFVVELTVESNDSIGVSDQVVFATAPLPQVFPTGDVTSTFGCKAPRLDAYDKRPKPGDTIRVTGRDLGIGGDAVLGDRSLVAADWTADGFALEVPEDATGTLALTVDCGARSNTIAIAVFSKPDNRFSIRKKAVAAGVVTLSVKVPGPGKLQTTGARTKRSKITVRKAGRATVRVRLSRAGRKALQSTKSGTLKVKTRVRFTPAGGKPATKTIVLTFEKVGR